MRKLVVIRVPFFSVVSTMDIPTIPTIRQVVSFPDCQSLSSEDESRVIRPGYTL